MASRTDLLAPCTLDFFVFFLHIQEWWATYELRQIESLRLPTFLFVLLYPINLFILARILFPLAQPESEFDLKVFYYASYRKFFIWASTLPLLSIVNNVFVTDHPLYSQTGQIVIFIGLLFMASRKNMAERVHQIAAALLFGIVLIILGSCGMRH